MAIDKRYAIECAKRSDGWYQAHLFRMTKRDGATVNSRLYTSAKYLTKEQAELDAESHYRTYYAK
jgi:hypothetical protein